MRGDGRWEWWFDGADGGSATRRTEWVRIGEISAWLTEGNRELIPETRGSILEGTICYVSMNLQSSEQFNLRTNKIIQNGKSAFSPDQSVPSFAGSARLLHGCSGAYAALPYLVRYTVRIVLVDIKARCNLARYGQWSFYVSGPSLWNSLPLTVRDSSLTLTQFCTRLKTFLFTGAYGTSP